MLLKKDNQAVLNSRFTSHVVTVITPNLTKKTNNILILLLNSEKSASTTRSSSHPYMPLPLTRGEHVILVCN